MMKTATPSISYLLSLAVKSSLLDSRTMVLRERETRSFDLGADERCYLSVQEGAAWVTMESCADDFALTTDHPRAGFAGPGRLVIEALTGGVSLRMSPGSAV